MEILSYKTLESQSYDGYLLKEAPERVLQFGEGNFLRAFVDYFIDLVKISTNTALFEKKGNWIDFNAGTVADGTETLDEAGDRLLDFVLEIASGRLTRQEEAGYREISIFKDGVAL